MCGITGIYSKHDRQPEREVLVRMMNAITHRGPDDAATWLAPGIGFGFRRLSIMDLAGGMQPFFSPDRQVVLVCNGEIFNYKELKQKLQAKGHTFKTQCDVEVLLPLYLEMGISFLSELNGQFALAIYDGKDHSLLLARDHFGICPLFYACEKDNLLFGSEIKALLEHPLVQRRIDMNGLDQILSFPANVGPTTLFDQVKSLLPGHWLHISATGIREGEYWDMDYPLVGSEPGYKSEEEGLEALEAALKQAVKYRLQADVPVGYYLSGGLDSSLIGAVIPELKSTTQVRSFSATFPDAQNAEIDESRFQRLVASHTASVHEEIPFRWAGFEKQLQEVIRHAESPLKETYNVCSLALAGAVRERGIKVVLCGEGADELFGGYLGYKFDRNTPAAEKGMDDYLEEEKRLAMWGDPRMAYDLDQTAMQEVKQALYAPGLASDLASFESWRNLPINRGRITGRDRFHQRSYIDLKIRLAGHLLADHGDRMTQARGVEGRYPFLDTEVARVAARMPAEWKLKNLEEKYPLRCMARKRLPKAILDREKFGFVAPGSPELLQHGSEWALDMLSAERIARQGFFNPQTVERLKARYSKPGFRLQLPYEQDLLMVVLTFGVFLDQFKLSGINLELTANHT